MKYANKHLLFWLLVFSISTSLQLHGQTKGASRLKGISIEAGIVSAPSFEIWAGYGLGYRLGKHRFGATICAHELRPAYDTWFRAYGFEYSAKVAFSVSHRLDLWKRNRWTMLTNTIFQVQRINIFDGRFSHPDDYILLGSYPRFQLSTGLGMQMEVFKGLYLLQTVRYGVARGNFFLISNEVTHWTSGICADLSIGFEL
jgi:hypothetical protein